MSFCFQNQLYVCWHRGKEQKFVKGLVNLNMNVPEGEFYIFSILIPFLYNLYNTFLKKQIWLYYILSLERIMAINKMWPN